MPEWFYHNVHVSVLKAEHTSVSLNCFTFYSTKLVFKALLSSILIVYYARNEEFDNVVSLVETHDLNF